MKITKLFTNIAPSFMARSYMAISLVIACSCSGDESDNPSKGDDINHQASAEVLATLQDVWETSPNYTAQDDRLEAYAKIQGWADECSSELVFKKYLTADQSTASALQDSYPILSCYDEAFERVLTALKTNAPSGNQAKIWLLYNMGVVVQTPVGNYAIDIYHRRGAELMPYIDFYAITHLHADHRCDLLAEAMSKAGKPVLTNFVIDGVSNGSYCSTEARDYSIGSFNIRTFITHHNNSSSLSTLPVTVYYVDGGGLKLLHSGDSNFIAEEFEPARNLDVDAYVFRYAVDALTENRVLGNAVNPKVAILSHILELGHADVANSRWPLLFGLERAAQLNCSHVVMPFWGDCIVF